MRQTLVAGGSRVKERLFHCGSELFDAFGISLESEITYADFCEEMIWLYREGIRFTRDALLITDLHEGQCDWAEAGELRFYPWDNILSIRNVKGVEVLQEYECHQIREWVSSLAHPSMTYPYLRATRGHIAFIVEGTPRSFRSKGGKARLREDVLSRREAIEASFGRALQGPVEMMVDVFSTSPANFPDVDRFSNSIMDAFQGLAYLDDKHVKHLRPRVFESSSAFERLECTSEPMPHFEIEDIPPGSLFPLATGMLDYYVVRIRPHS